MGRMTRFDMAVTSVRYLPAHPSDLQGLGLRWFSLGSAPRECAREAADNDPHDDLANVHDLNATLKPADANRCTPFSDVRL